VEPFSFITIIIQGETKEQDENKRNEQENENEGVEQEEERIFPTLKMWRMNNCLTKR
jgi:hypothetical protein